MKSPFTGKEMKRIFEKRTWKFRGEQYEYIHSAWRCEDTGELFTTDESDDAGFLQVTNQYRQKYGIPYVDEIVGIRQSYGISAARMALILGIGVNQYRLYEQGEVPSVSNGRMIRSVTEPEVMLGLVESSRNELTPQEYERTIRKVDLAARDRADREIALYETGRIFACRRGAENGYAPTSLTHLRNVMLTILDQCGDVWCTKMNKLLFYTDFLSYRERGAAMTGLAYRAIDFGPVPERWDRVYCQFDGIRQTLTRAGDHIGSVLTAAEHPDTGGLSEKENAIITSVCRRFADATSRDISLISHEEDAWKNHSVNRDRIPFSDSFTIKAL